MLFMNNFKNYTDQFKVREKLQPVFFIGHGSPMNGIEQNIFSKKWQEIGKTIDLPCAVLVVSAHWLTTGTLITAMSEPKTIHDFGGFPKELFDVQYPAPGSPFLAEETTKLITSTNVGLDHDWGLDHGTWTVVRHMFPDANVPVLQLSIDYNKPAAYHYNLAKELYDLRKRGVLVIGSGNMIHNLRMIDWNNMAEPGFGFDWAKSLNETFKKRILSKDHKDLIEYDRLGEAARLAIPTPDHYYPMLYALALMNNKDDVSIFNDEYVGGSLSMTSFCLG
ncbi:4,5-DOPA-extradiol-dioxygenase [Paenimyroides baculatum]|uniref:4,5-DOPA dioxygenase extradiol n=2 Tax=Paenimyroides baculatum TaxID=2608000 RepID=A0A5M6CS52_9FLAO|nr:4,5-DOPA dioxygenase extradiol [Paenimyroides baculatum]